MQQNVLGELMGTIRDRQKRPRSDSYTTQLISQGMPGIGAKILEEAREVVEAATDLQQSADPKNLIHEAADLVYHLCVALAYCNVDWLEIEQELLRRSGMSGLAEKAARDQGPSN
jgi:phosphoribosyl-ATP pyrophosphohydrolase